jgi:CBS domain-containing protein
MIGGSFGGILGGLIVRAFPGVHVSPSAFAVVAMAATFGAATRATFAAIVFVFEITQDYRVILPLMVATVLADLIMRSLLADSLLTEKLTRRGIRGHGDYRVDPLQVTLVRQVMTGEVETIASSASVGEAREKFETGPHSAYPVMDEHHLTGVVSRGDLLRYEGDEAAPVMNLASSDVVCVRPSATLREAMQLIVEEGVDHLPVVDGGELLGICTRTDIIRTRRREFEHDRIQPGWSAGLRRRRRSS